MNRDENPFASPKPDADHGSPPRDPTYWRDVFWSFAVVIGVVFFGVITTLLRSMFSN